MKIAGNFVTSPHSGGVGGGARRPPPGSRGSALVGVQGAKPPGAPGFSAIRRMFG